MTLSNIVADVVQCEIDQANLQSFLKNATRQSQLNLIYALPFQKF